MLTDAEKRMLESGHLEWAVQADGTERLQYSVRKMVDERRYLEWVFEVDSEPD